MGFLASFQFLCAGLGLPPLLLRPHMFSPFPCPWRWCEICQHGPHFSLGSDSCLSTRQGNLLRVKPCRSFLFLLTPPELLICWFLFNTNVHVHKATNILLVTDVSSIVSPILGTVAQLLTLFSVPHMLLPARAMWASLHQAPWRSGSMCIYTVEMT